jgi:hypothetical protein
MLGSVDEYKLPADYHWPTDTADRVDYARVADAARLSWGVVRRLASAPSSAAGTADASGRRPVRRRSRSSSRCG